MSALHISRISTRLHELYDGKIDLSDFSGDDVQRENLFKSRALAAYALMVIADVQTEISAAAITDGSNDNGIDVIHIDKEQKIIYIGQSKWIQSGNGSFELGEHLKFIKGVDDLLNSSFNNFNQKIILREEEIRNAIYDAEYKIKLLYIYTGSQELSTHILPNLTQFLERVNDTSELIEYDTINQKKIYDFILSGSDEGDVDTDIKLFEWGFHDEPYRAYYGQIRLADISDWWSSYNTRLFAKNLRKFKGDTEVNSGIRHTLSKSPKDFWYYNNGITILCKSVKKTLSGAGDRKEGVFECKGISVVNGAQTVGTIGEELKDKRDVDAYALIKLISLEGTPDGYANQITRYNNTQNRIENKDFAALDPIQERLRKELLLDDIKYFYKSGDEIPIGDKTAISLESATIALACTQSLALSVQAKRAVGQLWLEPFYRNIFNTSTTSVKVQKSVKLLNIVDDTFSNESKKMRGKDLMTMVHGNRLLLHIVFCQLSNFNLESPSTIISEEEEVNIKDITRKTIQKLISSIQELYPDSYLNSLFKNAEKCEELKQNILQPKRRQENLFE